MVLPLKTAGGHLERLRLAHSTRASPERGFRLVHVFGKSISAGISYLFFRIFHVFGKSLCKVMFSKKYSNIRVLFYFCKNI